MRDFKALYPAIPTKSGLMLGLGETLDEIAEVLCDLREDGCDMLTIGQYLQTSRDHASVTRYASPDEFAELEVLAKQLGYSAVASGPMVRSSYHADQQAQTLLADQPRQIGAYPRHSGNQAGKINFLSRRVAWVSTYIECSY